MLKQSILIVEDEALILFDVESALTDAGFDVVTAKTGEGALAQFDTDPGRFKELVTDIRLGEGQSGWDIARHVREAGPTMPVVYMSGDSAPAWHARGVPDSVMIQKPFVVAQITTALSTLLNNAPAAPSDAGSHA
ncbi:response regulator [Mesorhizobium sp. INR15]|uniref:response regulator n=1 Tax=Mesorhizobium sp. INR15 TaxID=2654248 RepID=UPI001896946D|nr:response regulator [Mesorhizobium sp. INR15]QPC94841.1 response regulator [Mesorhizobium sp. INR15]